MTEDWIAARIGTSGRVLAEPDEVRALVAQARAEGGRAERDRYERIHRRYWRLGKTGDGAGDIFDDFLHGADYPDEALP